MNKHYLEMPLEELCARILSELAAASDELLSADIAGSTHDRAMITCWATRVHGDDGLKPGMSASITPILALLESHLDDETKGYRNIFEGHPDTEEGPVGDVICRRVLTERGVRIQVWIGRLRRLRHMLQVAEFRFNAKRAVNRRVAH
jgi:hypothetical protein